MRVRLRLCGFNTPGGRSPRSFVPIDYRPDHSVQKSPGEDQLHHYCIMYTSPSKQHLLLFTPMYFVTLTLDFKTL